MINLIMSCNCGHEEKVQAIPAFGSPWQCPQCNEVTVRVRPLRGGEVWIVIPPRHVEFFNLLDDDEDDEDDECSGGKP